MNSEDIVMVTPFPPLTDTFRADYVLFTNDIVHLLAVHMHIIQCTRTHIMTYTHREGIYLSLSISVSRQHPHTGSLCSLPTRVSISSLICG